MEEDKTDKKDSLLFLYSLLKRLGCGEVGTFEQRLRTQKVQYFAQLFRVSFKYQYNLYMRGPYAPALAEDLYKIKELNLKADVDKFIPEKLEQRFSDLHSFISKRSTRELEVAATYHWFLKVAELNEKTAITKLVEWKGATEEEIIQAKNSLSEYEHIKASYN